MDVDILKICMKDFLGLKNVIYENKKHIKAAGDWLKYAQDQTKDGGVATSYHTIFGWYSSYPETTGYIIPTFFKLAKYFKDDDFYDRALIMGEWLLSRQLENGGFIGGRVDRPSGILVFDSGMILIGLITLFKEVKEGKYISAAKKVGDFLIKAQKNGKWVKYSLNNIPHSYHSRVSWALLQLYQVTNEEKYKNAACKNLEYIIKQQKENGWFFQCSFLHNYPPLTHTIAYTVRGILEAGLILNNSQYIKSAVKTANVLLKLFNENKILYGNYDEEWKKKGNHSCLVGNAQISIIWNKIHSITKEKQYLLAAEKMNNLLKSTQILKTKNRNIKGGIKGSIPFYKGYEKFAFPNWAAKFFIDSLLLEESKR